MIVLLGVRLLCRMVSVGWVLKGVLNVVIIWLLKILVGVIILVIVCFEMVRVFRFRCVCMDFISVGSLFVL